MVFQLLISQNNFLYNVKKHKDIGKSQHVVHNIVRTKFQIVEFRQSANYPIYAKYFHDRSDIADKNLSYVNVIISYISIRYIEIQEKIAFGPLTILLHLLLNSQVSLVSN